MTAGFVVSDDEDIYYETWGDGQDTVVFSHGMGGSHAVWYQQVPYFSDDYRVITWDQRGFGRSTVRKGDAGPIPSVRDLRRILDHLGIETAHLVGQSMGGWVSLLFAIKHADRVVSMVLADTTGGIYTPAIRSALEAYGEVIRAGPRPDQMPLGRHPAIGVQLLAEDLARSFLYGQLGSLSPPLSPDVVIPLLLANDNTTGATMTETPTLFVVGENDPIFPPMLIDEAAALRPGSRVAVVENTGHSPYFERPDAWNRIVEGFLAESAAP